MTVGKTVPELTAETPPIVGTDEVVVYRSPGPLKRTTAATVRTYMQSNLGTMATQNANAVAITGGSITGITDLAVADGGTGAGTADGALTNLGGTTVGKAVFTAANAAAARTATGTVIGTDVQAYDADLQAIAALTSAADKMPYATGAQAWAMADLTSFARTLLATANNSAFLTALGQIASSFVDFVNAGTGAVTRTVQARLRDTVSAFDFIPVAEQAAIVAGTSTYDATAAIQAAINTGKTVEFPAGDYQAVGLTMSTDRQRLVARGDVKIIKNGNGVILSSGANNIELNGIAFRGESATPAFTGHNISLTGTGPRLINCGSRWAFARALKSTGSNLQLYGTCDIYQTTDATASGYDIEVGVSGTASLYHEIHGYYSSQSTGGILFVDCGSQTIVGGEFGKLNISSGTSPSGVNGGKYVGARILGNVTVGISSAVFTGNQFSNITFTISAGISGVAVDVSNTFAVGATVTNNGSVANSIQLDGGVGGQTAIKYGGSTSLAIVGYDPATGDQYITSGYTRYASDRGVVFNGIANITANASNVTFINNTGSIFYGVAGGHEFFVSGTLYGTINTTGFRLPSGAALYNNSIKVVGAQGAAVADATDAASVIARLNDLLSRLRTHGLIAT